MNIINYRARTRNNKSLMRAWAKVATPRDAGGHCRASPPKTTAAPLFLAPLLGAQHKKKEEKKPARLSLTPLAWL